MFEISKQRFFGEMGLPVVLSTQKLTARARAKVDRALLITGKMTDNSAWK